MSHVCLRDEELATAAGRIDGGYDGQEWLRCARCRSRLAAFREFRDPARIPAGCWSGEADLRLAGLFGEQNFAGLPEEGDAAPQSIPSAGSSGGRGVRRTWWARHRMARLAWAAAAMAVMVWAGHEAGVFDRRAGREIQLREGGGAGQPDLQTHAPVLEPGGGVRFSWEAVSGAERYDVVIHGVDLLEILRLDAGSDLSVRLAADDADRICSAPGSCFWRVAAYAGGEKVAQSRIRPLSLREAP